MTVVQPGAVGLDDDLPARLRALVAAQIADGLADGMQLFVARHGNVVVDDAVGRCAQLDVAVDHDTRFHLASASKALTITVLHQAVERGLVSYGDPVVRHIPEFGRHGKEDVTVHHVLTHRGGFPDLAMRSLPAALSGDWDAAVAAVCDLEPEQPPGTQVVYHGFTASLVLAEIARRVDGRSFTDICREDVLEPLGMAHTSWGEPDGPGPNAIRGRDEALDRDVTIWRTPEALTAVLPGANLHSTASDVGALYLALGGHGPRLLAPATVDHATRLYAPMTPGIGFGFGLGFMVGTEPGMLLSRGALGSPRAFGHPGMTFTQALCEPRDGLVMVFLANVASTQEDSDRRFGVLCDTVHRAVLDRTPTEGAHA